MAHRVDRHFGRPTGARLALFRGLVTNLIKHERIRTTVAKAKEVRPFVEKYVTLAKDGTIGSRRQAHAFIYEDLMVQKLFYQLAERYRTRPGGYTRIIRDGFRAGDGAEMAILEFVDRDKGPFIPLPEHPSIPSVVRQASLGPQIKTPDEADAVGGRT